MMVALMVAFLVGVAGGLLSSFLGWAESDEPFILRKMVTALIRGGVGGIVVVTGFLQTHPNVMGIDYAIIFLAAMGIDLAAAKGWNIVEKAKANAP